MSSPEGKTIHFSLTRYICHCCGESFEEEEIEGHQKNCEGLKILHRKTTYIY